MKRNSFSAVFARRTAISFFLIVFLFLGTVLKIASVSTQNYAEVQAKQSSKRITVSRVRGTIFDCNMVPLTNSTSKLIAAVSPTVRATVAISAMLEDEKREYVLEQLRHGTPVVCEVPYDPECVGIAVTEVYTHATSETPAVHAVGYTDGDGHGVSGLEAAYDDILFCEKTVDAIFSTDGKGGILSGDEPYFENAATAIGNGVITTLDTNIQNITENACRGIITGAAVVCEIESGKIRAIHSRPTFDITDVSASLSGENSPLLDRTLAAFSVGSVFKPCVAAALLENGNADEKCLCTGNVVIGNRTFNCHARSGHGEVDLKTAIAHSCNSFFYGIAAKVGADPICKTASALGFGSSLTLCKGIKTASGNMPKATTLTTDADLANIGIGQGQLLLSPVSILTLYCAIAADGCYVTPSLTEGSVQNGKITESRKVSHTKVMRADTAAALRECLEEVIISGTGGAAAPTHCKAAGKTATAQTGRYLNGKEITNSWFCGYFPADAPKYAVAVMSEGTPQKSTAAVFADIADGICELKGISDIRQETAE